MIYSLDTNTCVESLRGTNPRVAAKFSTITPSDVVICSVVRAELWYGAEHSQHPAVQLAKVAAFLTPFATQIFDDAAARAYGTLRASLRKAGTIIGPNDLLIATLALVNGSIMVTHNTVEFARVPNLTLEDWEI